MFHYFSGDIVHYGTHTYILSTDAHGQSQQWLQIHYLGQQSSGWLFLFPYLDDTNKTIKYFAFDTPEQKFLFEKMCKISGIGPQTAQHIARIPYESLSHAVQEFDESVFTSISGVGPKTAKKLLIELKTSLSDKDIAKINNDNKLYKDIIKSLKTMGYEWSKVEEILKKYEGDITKESLSETMMWVIKQL